MRARKNGSLFLSALLATLSLYYGCRTGSASLSEQQAAPVPPPPGSIGARPFVLTESVYALSNANSTMTIRPILSRDDPNGANSFTALRIDDGVVHSQIFRRQGATDVFINEPAAANNIKITIELSSQIEFKLSYAGKNGPFMAGSYKKVPPLLPRPSDLGILVLKMRDADLDISFYKRSSQLGESVCFLVPQRQLNLINEEETNLPLVLAALKRDPKLIDSLFGANKPVGPLVGAIMERTEKQYNAGDNFIDHLYSIAIKDSRKVIPGVNADGDPLPPSNISKRFGRCFVNLNY